MMTPPAERGQRGAGGRGRIAEEGAQENQDPITTRAEPSLRARGGLFSRRQRWWWKVFVVKGRQAVAERSERVFSGQRAKKKKSLLEVSSDIPLLDTCM